MITDDLFRNVSTIVNYRVTPDNVRSKFQDIAATGGITPKVKTDVLVELLVAFSELEKKIDGQPSPKPQSV